MQEEETKGGKQTPFPTSEQGQARGDGSNNQRKTPEDGTNAAQAQAPQWALFTKRAKIMYTPQGTKTTATKVTHKDEKATPEPIQPARTPYMSQSTVQAQNLQEDDARGNPNIVVKKTSNVVDYRRQLFKAFETCQRDYINRMQQRGRTIQLEPSILTSESSDADLKTCDPPIHSQGSSMQKLTKFGGVLKAQKSRFFLLDNQNIVYFMKDTDKIAKGFKSLVGGKARLESKTEVSNERGSPKWIDGDKNHRILITVEGKENKPMFVYSNDINACKALIVRVKLMANPDLQQRLQALVPKVSFIYRLSLFRNFWTTTKRIYDHRTKSMKKFKALGKALTAVASQNWQRNRHMIKGLSDMVENQVTISDLNPRLLISTFRTGRIRHVPKSVEVNISLLLLHRLHQLISMIRSRRLLRKPDVANSINDVLMREIEGATSTFIMMQSFHANGTAVQDGLFKIENSTARVAFEPHSPNSMLIEQLAPEKAKDPSFFTKDFTRQVDLGQISLIATDLDSFFSGPDQVDDAEHTIQIYGPCSQASMQISGTGNDATEFTGLAPLRKAAHSARTIEIKVSKVELPVNFVRLHNGKGFIRIRLVQGVGTEERGNEQDRDFEMDPYRTYSSVSEDFRLSVPDIAIATRGLANSDMMSVPLPQPIFFALKPLLVPESEQFYLQLIFSANLSPIPSVIKDYMVETVYRSKLNAGSVSENEIVYAVEDEIGGQAKIYAQIKKSPSREIDEREGLRILIGRYCLLDNRMQMQVIDYNADTETFTLRSVRGRGLIKREIPLWRINRIERYGVSVYDLRSMPKQIEQSNFEFICTLTTRDRGLITMLLRKIQDLHVRRTFAKRQQLEQKSRIASGNLFCSIIEANNLRKSLTVQKQGKAIVLPYVKITIEHIPRDQDPKPLVGQLFQTEIIGTAQQDRKGQRSLLKKASWASSKNLTGSLHDLGEFKKNMGHTSQTASNEMEKIADSHKQNIKIGRRSTVVLNLQDARRQAEHIVVENEMSVLDDSERVGLNGAHADNSLFDLLETVNPEDVYIRFQVFNSKIPKGQKRQMLLGQSLIQATRLISLDQPQKATQLLLLLPTNLVDQQLDQNEVLTEDKMFSGTLSVQTLFVPDRETRWNFEMYECRSEITDPEAMAHLNQLLQPILFDSYHYRVPTETYSPWHFSNDSYFKQEVRSRPRILVDKNMLRQKMQELHREYKQAHGLIEDRKYQLLKHMITLTLESKLFASHDEINDFFMWTEDDFRPMKQDFSANFMHRWLALTAQNNYESRKRLTRFLWQQFITELIKSGAAGVPSSNYSEDDMMSESETERGSIEDQNQQLKISQTDSIVVGFQNFKAQNPSNNNLPEDRDIYRDSMRGNLDIRRKSTLPQALGHVLNKIKNPMTMQTEPNEIYLLKNSDLNIFRNRAEWEANKSCSQYADLHYLVLQGIPDEFRVRLWKDLLRTEQAEKSSIPLFKQAYPMYTYDSSTNLYNNYLNMSQELDCLAFRQIDEDIFKYEPSESYLRDCPTTYERDLILRGEKSSLRNLLRVLTLWSKQSIFEKQTGVIAYGTGFLDMMQRLNAITQSEQECFAILTGIIQNNPRPFTAPKSILLERCETMMRYEMTALKTMIEHSLPNVYTKLKALGLPIELLTYRSITSFYAADFSTEVVHRLWDIIIFFLSSTQPDERKRGLWWLLSPAFLIFQEKADAICACVSCEEVISVYRAGGAMSYDPDWFVDKIKEINFRIFVEGKVKQKNAVQAFISSQIEVENAFAQKFEEKRAENMSKQIKLFEQTTEENQSINDLMREANLQLQEDGAMSEYIAIDGAQLRKDIFSGIEKILVGETPQVHRRRSTIVILSRQHALEQQQRRQTMLERVQSQDGELKEHLPVSRIHIYVQSFEMASENVPHMHALRVQYGRVDPKTGIFIVEKLSDDVELEIKAEFGPNPIELMAQFKYIAGNNFLMLELFNKLNGRQILTKLVSLVRLPINRFTEKRLLAQGRQQSQVSSEHIQVHLNTSLFLEQPSALSNRGSEVKKLIASFMRKRPDFVDVFESGKSDYQHMTSQFESLVKAEFAKASRLLGKDTALDIINDEYNHVVTGTDYGKVSFNQFLHMVTTMLPEAMHSPVQLDMIYSIFTGEQITESARKDHDAAAKLKQRMTHLKKLAKLGSSILPTPGQTDLDSDVPKEFSLSKFFISCVLMSHSTVEEKLSLLYDCFARLCGFTQENAPTVLFELISVIFERNMYFWPAQELYNQVEQVFTDSIGMVQGAYWTNDLSLLEGWRADVQANAIQETRADEEQTPDDDFDFANLEERQDENLMNVTAEVQASITRYFSVFGTKTIDFNADVSPFRHLSDLVGERKAKSMLKVAAEHQASFTLVLFCMTEGERFSFVLHYSNENGILLPGSGAHRNNVGTNSSVSFKSIMERDCNKLFLSGMTRPISKQEFLEKIEHIPFFTNLIRVETFVRDRQLSTLRPKTPTLPVFISFYAANSVFVFNFENRRKRVIEGHAVTLDGSSFRFEMNALCEQDTLSDARNRISMAMIVAHGSMATSKHFKDTSLAMFGDVIGSRDLQVLSSSTGERSLMPNAFHWRLLSNDMLRIEQLGTAERNKNRWFILKLESSGASRLTKSLQERESPESYDCLAFYKHADQSFDWMPCKIVSRRLKHELAQLQNVSFNAQCFEYQVAFLHLARKEETQTISRNVFIRSAEQILFSASYTRVLQRNFKQECLHYIRTTYNQGKNVLSGYLGVMADLKSATNNSQSGLFAPQNNDAAPAQFQRTAAVADIVPLNKGQQNVHKAAQTTSNIKILIDDDIQPDSTNRIHPDRRGNQNDDMLKNLAEDSDDFEFTPKKPVSATDSAIQPPKHYVRDMPGNDDDPDISFDDSDDGDQQEKESVIESKSQLSDSMASMSEVQVSGSRGTVDKVDLLQRIKGSYKKD